LLRAIAYACGKRANLQQIKSGKTMAPVGGRGRVGERQGEVEDAGRGGGEELPCFLLPLTVTRVRKGPC